MGTPNRGKITRSLLNVVIAASAEALQEENYLSIFPATAIKEEYHWMQRVFDESFLESFTNGSFCKAGINGCPQDWSLRRIALQERIQAQPAPPWKTRLPIGVILLLACLLAT